MAGDFILQGVSFPFRFSGRGGVATSKADSVDNSHIEEAILQCLGTSIGERFMNPEFGSDLIRVPFESFDDTIIGIIKYRVTQSLTRWVPYIEVEEVSIEPETDNERGIVSLFVSYVVVRTRVRGNVSLTLTKAGG